MRVAIRIVAVTAAFILAGASFVVPTRAATNGNVSLKLPAAPVAVDGPTLKADKKASAETVNAPGIVTFTLVIRNTGAATLENIAVEERLPAGFAYAKRDTFAKLKDLGVLGPGTSLTFSYDVDIAAEAKAGRYPNETDVSAAGVDAVEVTAPVNVTIGQVLGAEDDLVATGPSLRDYLILTFGAAAVSVGLMLMRRSAAI